MARVEIRHKCIVIAREAARRDSNARVTGRSTYVKRCYGSYRIIMVKVTQQQRTCRDIFADAQKLAQRDLRTWNRRRHWEREAKRHKVKGAHRMAVSWFYKALKERGEELREEVMKSRVERLAKTETDKVGEGRRRDDYREQVKRWTYTVEWEEMEKRSPFWYRKFGDLEEYYGAVMREAS